MSGSTWPARVSDRASAGQGLRESCARGAGGIGRRGSLLRTEGSPFERTGVGTRRILPLAERDRQRSQRWPVPSADGVSPLAPTRPAALTYAASPAQAYRSPLAQARPVGLRPPGRRTLRPLLYRAPVHRLGPLRPGQPGSTTSALSSTLAHGFTTCRPAPRRGSTSRPPAPRPRRPRPERRPYVDPAAERPSLPRPSRIAAFIALVECARVAGRGYGRISSRTALAPRALEAGGEAVRGQLAGWRGHGPAYEVAFASSLGDPARLHGGQDACGAGDGGIVDDDHRPAAVGVADGFGSARSLAAIAPWVSWCEWARGRRFRRQRCSRRRGRRSRRGGGLRRRTSRGRRVR